MGYITEAAAEVLEDAARIIERDGWIQMNYHNGHGHCALGAIQLARAGEWYSFADRMWIDEKAVAALTQVIGQPSIPAWNDAPGQSKEDVLLAFKLAVEKLRTSNDGERIEVMAA